MYTVELKVAGKYYTLQTKYLCQAEELVNELRAGALEAWVTPKEVAQDTSEDDDNIPF